jgi:VanZ family protein
MRRPLRLLILLAWMALVTYWSNQPVLPIDQPSVADAMHNLQHRIAHVLVYGLMALLAWWTLDGRPRAWLIAIAITSVFGMTDEFHQSFIPGRRAAVDDWLLDTLSAALAIFLVAQLRKSRIQPALNILAPLVVCAAFAVGIALAVRPALSSAVALLRFGGS